LDSKAGVIIDVDDEGSGIPDAEKEKVFEPSAIPQDCAFGSSFLKR
jgi:signal transduction histidine kinase